MFSKIKMFLSQVRVELKKVVWPSRNEVYGTTIVVIITVFIFSLFLYIMDIIFAKGIRHLFSIFK